jgi:hypothetical protein
MDGAGEHHLSEVSKAQKTKKSYVLLHMQTLDLGQIQQGYWTWSHDKERAHKGSMRIGKKPKT